MVIVFDVVSRPSFEKAANWLQSVCKETSGSIPIVLVGNKSDLIPFDSDPVKKEEAQKLADENELRYF